MHGVRPEDGESWRDPVKHHEKLLLSSESKDSALSSWSNVILHKYGIL